MLYFYTKIGVVIFQINESGNECPAGEVGEICGRGPILMSAYDKRPDLTAEAIKDGWLHSGDLGYVDDDSFLYLVDCLNDMIISGGVNVYPRDIEEIVAMWPAKLSSALCETTMGKTINKS